MRISHLLAALPLLASCAIGREHVSAAVPELLPQYDQASAAEQRLKEALPGLELAAEIAVQSPDPSDDLPAAEALAHANADLQQAEGVLAKVDEAVLRKHSAPLGGLLPYGLGYAAIEGIVALASGRKRRLYVSAMRSMSKGQLLTSAAEILKALGAFHSSPPVSASASGSFGSAPIVVNFSPGSGDAPAPAPLP